MRLYNFLHFAAASLCIGLLVFVMLTGCVQGSELLASHEFYHGATNESIKYDFAENIGAGLATRSIVSLYIAEPSLYLASDTLTITYDRSRVVNYPKDVFGNDRMNYYIESDLKIGASVVGHCTHGYSVGTDKIYYHFIFDSLDLEGYGSGQTIVIDNPIAALDLQILGDQVHFENYFEDEYLYVWEYAYPKWYTIGDGNQYDTPVEYEIYSSYAFDNYFYIYDLGSCYRLDIQRENISGWDDAVESKWYVYDANYTYINETEYVNYNTSSYVLPACFDTFCDVLYVSVTTPYGDFWGTREFTDLCKVPEPGYFNLSGYTRSTDGNLIPSVKLTAQGGIEYSNNIGFYQFENLATGSFTLDANKTGYNNSSESLYIGSAGDYQHDVYMIPLDALDTGEFGGVIYDYCTRKPILGAYVYLFNETADSGSYAYSNKYGFYRFAGMTEGMDYEVSASKDGYDASIVHSFTFNESNVNETHYKTKNIWLLPEGGCPDEPIPTSPPAPTPIPHEWTNEEIIGWLRVNLMSMFIIVLMLTFLWFIRKAGGSKW